MCKAFNIQNKRRSACFALSEQTVGTYLGKATDSVLTDWLTDSFRQLKQKLWQSPFSEPHNNIPCERWILRKNAKSFYIHDNNQIQVQKHWVASKTHDSTTDSLMSVYLEYYSYLYYYGHFPLWAILATARRDSTSEERTPAGGPHMRLGPLKAASFCFKKHNSVGGLCEWWFKRMRDPLLRRAWTGETGWSDASQKNSQEGAAPVALRVQFHKKKPALFSFKQRKCNLFAVLTCPLDIPFSRLGPGALTDRQTKTPQPRCSAPPPAALKGPAAPRPSAGPSSTSTVSQGSARFWPPGDILVHESMKRIRALKKMKKPPSAPF